ncbi:MAG: pyridoxal phosphate-dependent aminotransferase [Deltaproteobacteria bacterium]|jgi:aspartate aminotransferase|nr:MAG: pyridoxal phosphate-dependent aminotransferase [Deltaproteobacteria bacterium]
MPTSPEIREAIRQGSWIRKMFEEGARLKSAMGPDNVFDFSLGNPYGAPPVELLEEIRKLAAAPPADLHRYMPNAGFPEVRNTVAASLERSTGLPFRGDHVIMTTGAAGALNVALRAILSPGDEVLVIAPYFAEYLFYIRNVGGVPVVAESAEDFQLDVGAIRAALSDRTKAVILNTPNNPTGAVYPREALLALDECLAGREKRTGNPVYVLSDEPYRKIVYPGFSFVPPAAALRNTLIAYSHSKDLNVPGERIGYLAVSPRAADAGEISEASVFCNRVLGFVNAPSLMQRAVAVVQDLEPDFPVYRANRDALVATLADAGFPVVPPGGAFYLFPRSPSGDEMEFVAAAREENLLVVPGSGFGRKGHFRVAFCVPPDTVTRSLPAWRRLGGRFFPGRGQGAVR